MNGQDAWATVKALESRVKDLETTIAAIKAVFTGGGAPGGDVADDDELDSKFGDPVIRRDPKGWPGDSFMGHKFSMTTPEYLDAMAKYKDLCAKMTRKNGDAAKLKYAAYDEKDAARARGWAKRLRGGWKPAALPAASSEPFPATGGFGDGDGGFGGADDFAPGDDIPFIVEASRLGWGRP